MKPSFCLSLILTIVAIANTATAQQLTVSIAVYPSANLPVGNTLDVKATWNQNLNPQYYVGLFGYNNTLRESLGSCSGCGVANGSSYYYIFILPGPNKPTTFTFQAAISTNTLPENCTGALACSNPITVTWYSPNSTTSITSSIPTTSSSTLSTSVSTTIATTTTATTTISTTYYTLNALSGLGGFIELFPAGNSGNQYASGASVNVIAVPSSGYNFVGWDGTGAGSYTGNNINASVVINGNILERGYFLLNTTNACNAWLTVYYDGSIKCGSWTINPYYDARSSSGSVNYASLNVYNTAYLYNGNLIAYNYLYPSTAYVFSGSSVTYTYAGQTLTVYASQINPSPSFTDQWAELRLVSGSQSTVSTMSTTSILSTSSYTISTTPTSTISSATTPYATTPTSIASTIPTTIQSTFVTTAPASTIPQSNQTTSGGLGGIVSSIIKSITDFFSNLFKWL